MWLATPDMPARNEQQAVRLILCRLPVQLLRLLDLAEPLRGIDQIGRQIQGQSDAAFGSKIPGLRHQPRD